MTLESGGFTEAGMDSKDIEIHFQNFSLDFEVSSLEYICPCGSEICQGIWSLHHRGP